MAPTVTEQRQRIQQIADTHIAAIVTVLNGDEAEITDAMLPALLVIPRGATRQARSRAMHLTTRDFDLILFVDLVTENTLWGQKSFVDAAEALLETVADYFRLSAPRLELNKAPLAGVIETGNISDDGPELRQWGKHVFSAAVGRLPVTTRRN